MAQPLDNYFAQDSSRLEGEVNRIMRETGRVSALIEKDVYPDGIGFNPISLLVNRSNGVGGAGWVNVAQENGSANNCYQSPSTTSPSLTERAYNLQSQLKQSYRVCFVDASKGYLFKKQVEAFKENFTEEIADVWEDQDKAQYALNAQHKIIANKSLSEDANVFLPTAPTTRLTEDILDQLYTRLMQDGAGRESYAQANGQPLITMICSMEQSRNVIRQDASVRQDYRFAWMGKEKDSPLMQSWGIDKAYAGFMHCIDNRMPRWNLVAGVWVQVPYYINTGASTVGNNNAAQVNPAYINAPYEDVYLWHPKVVRRLVPKPIGSVGADTQGDPVNWNGTIFWANERNLDQASSAYNPLKNWGQWFSAMMAAWEPIKVQYGYILRVQRCFTDTLNPCPSTGS